MSRTTMCGHRFPEGSFCMKMVVVREESVMMKDEIEALRARVAEQAEELEVLRERDIEANDALVELEEELERLRAQLAERKR